MKRFLAVALALFLCSSGVRAALTKSITDYQDGEEALEKFYTIGAQGRNLFMSSVKFKALYHRHLQIISYAYAGKGYSGTSVANADRERSSLRKAGDFSHKMASKMKGTLRTSLKLFKMQQNLKGFTTANPKQAIKKYRKTADSAVDSIMDLANNAEESSEGAPKDEDSQENQKRFKGAAKFLQGQAKGIQKQVKSFDKTLKTITKSSTGYNRKELIGMGNQAMKNLNAVYGQVKGALRTARAVQKIQFGTLEDIRNNAVSDIKDQTNELATILGFGRSIKPQVYKITEIMMQRSAMRTAGSSKNVQKRAARLLNTSNSMVSKTSDSSDSEEEAETAPEEDSGDEYDPSKAPKNLEDLTNYATPIKQSVLNKMDKMGTRDSIVSGIRDEIVSTLRQQPPERREKLAIEITGRASKAVEAMNKPEEGYKVINAVQKAKKEVDYE